ncbi:MAG: hypothetical protein WB615_09190 [Candidatus Tumulicola sp.]
MALPARKPSSPPANGAAEFLFSSGILYADKDEYVEKELVLTINAIEFQKKAGFEQSDRWAVTVTIDDGRPDEIITLPSNEQRDAELQDAAAHIAEHGPICNVQLVKSGKAFYFRNVAASAHR